MPVAVTCEHCGDTFQVRPCREDTARFCSNDCKHDAKQVTRKCDWCGDTYTVAQYRADATRFCSLGCLYQGRRTRWDKERNGNGDSAGCGHMDIYTVAGECARCDELDNREELAAMRDQVRDAKRPLIEYS